ncbi:MAG: hypothetical protein GY851_08920 [bacterium]|nr:hypothetical protein [bacterium]
MFPSIALLRRELLTRFRQGRTFSFLAISIVAATLPAVVKWANFPTVVNVEYFYSGDVARGIIDYAATFLMLGCGVFVPALAATSFTEERDTGTIDQLHMALLRPTGMVLAKCLSAIGFYVAVIIGTLPIIATAFFLLGVEWQRLIIDYSLVLAFSVICATAGVYASVVYRNTLTAIVMGYVAALIGIGILPSAAAFLVALVGGSAASGGLEEISAIISPAFALGYNVLDNLGWDRFWMNMVYCGSVSLCFVVLAVMRLQFQVLHDAVTAERIPDGRLQRLMRQIAKRRPRRSPMWHGFNPVLQRELRWNPLTRTRTVVYIFTGTLLLNLVSYAVLVVYARSRFPWFNVEFQPVAFWFYEQLAVFLVIIPMLAAASLARETESGNLDLLRTTFLSPRDIFRGKAYAALLPVCAALAGSALACMFALTLVGETRRAAIMTGFGTLAVSSATAYGLTLLASALAKRTSVALVLSFCLIAGVFLFSYGIARTGYEAIFVSESDVYAGSSPPPQRVAAFERARDGLAFLSPITAFHRNARGRGDSLPTRYWIVNCSVFLLVACGLFYGAEIAFHRLRMRTT